MMCLIVRPRSFGTGIIYVQGVAGEVLQSGRDTIYLHGGGGSLGSQAFDPNQPLRGTQGCVRCENQDINILIQAIKDLSANGDPLEGVYVGDSQYLIDLAGQQDQNGNFLYPDLRLALGLDQPPPEADAAGQRPLEVKRW